MTVYNIPFPNYNLYFERTQNRRLLTINISGISGRDYPHCDTIMSIFVQRLAHCRIFNAVDAYLEVIFINEMYIVPC